MDLDVRVSDYQALFDTRVNQGYMPRALTARDDAGETRFQVTWVPSVPPWYARHGDTPASLAAAASSFLASGFRPVFVESYGVAPFAEYFASLWIYEPGTTWEIRNGLTSAQYQADFNTLTSQGYKLFWVSGNGSGANARFASVFLQSSTLSWAIHDAQEATFLSLLASHPGTRLVSLSTYGPGGNMYAACIHGAPQPTQFLYHIHSRYEVSLESAARAQAGYQTSLVDCRQAGTKPSFSSIHLLDSATNVWRSNGIANPGMTSFDATMQTYMQANGIRHGSLAVTQNSRLMICRGYTWGPRTIPDTNAHSCFRIASLSKPMTAVGILRLAETGRLGANGVDSLLGNWISLGTWPTVDPRVQTITIRHLLHHRGGFNQQISVDPMFADSTVAAALSVPLPVSTQNIIDWMKTRPLDFTPGTQYQYSNFGYCLLGRVIEAVTGKSYEDFMYDEVLGPIGAGNLRVTASLFDAQLPRESIYGALPGQQVSSVMGGAGPATVPRQYGGWNLRNMDAHGGWAGSAADLARFAIAFDSPASSPLLTASSIAMMFSRYATDPTPSNYYAMGWLVIPFGASQTTWHDGLLTPASTRSWLVRRFDGVNWVLLFSDAPGSTSIEGAMHTAANGIGTWPTTDLFPQLAHTQTFGIGCNSTVGAMRVRPVVGHLPRLGEELGIRAESLPTNPAVNIPLMAVGFSNTSWLGGPLPVSLTPAGMTGCFLNVSAEVVTIVPNLSGTAVQTIRIPTSTAFVGLSLYYQGVVLSPGSNPAGIVLSHGLQAAIGS